MIDRCKFVGREVAALSAAFALMTAAPAAAATIVLNDGARELLLTGAPGVITSYDLHFFGSVDTVEARADWWSIYRYSVPDSQGGSFLMSETNNGALTAWCSTASSGMGCSYSNEGLTIGTYRTNFGWTVTVDNRLESYYNCDTPFEGRCSMQYQPAMVPIRLNAFGPQSLTYYVTTTAIPEPATWAMLIIGFGLAGGALRKRRGLAELA